MNAASAPPDPYAATEDDRRVVLRAGSITGATGLSSMPDDVASEGASRLALVAGLTLLFCIAGIIVALAFAQPNIGARAGTARPLWVVYACAGLSLAMLFVARSAKISVPRRLDVGLAYLIVLCAAAALYRHWLPYTVEDVARGFSPQSILLLFFSVVVPVRPRRMLFTAVIVTALDPLTLWLTVAVGGNPMPPWNIWLWMCAPTGAAGIVAVLMSRVIWNLGKKLNRARLMGSYQLVERLGAGGMGEVWRARHRLLARPAAIKLIKADALDAADPDRAERMLIRFEREAQATAALESPHTIELYDFGRASDGTLYFVMELLNGADLDSLVQRHGPMRPARVVHLLRQVCHSLRDAHAAGVVHRDIKPANIFVCRKGVEHDFVKVLDFGLVKQRDTGPGEAQLTADGAIGGTPAFMPPEMATGAEVDARTDLYALGCVAFWMLTGRQVFTGKTAVEVIVAHVRDEAPPLSESSELEIPAALEQLVARCLAKAPSDRPADAQAVMDALDAISADHPWSPADATRWWERVHADASDARR